MTNHHMRLATTLEELDEILKTQKLKELQFGEPTFDELRSLDRCLLTRVPLVKLILAGVQLGGSCTALLPPSLQYLELHQVEFDRIVLPRNLQTLHVIDCNNATALFRELKGLQSLQHVRWIDCRLENIPKNLPDTLLSLDFRGNRLSYKDFYCPPNVCKLLLEDTGLDTNAVQHLASILQRHPTLLQKLSLRDNNISDISALQNISVHTLDLSENPIQQVPTLTTRRLILESCRQLQGIESTHVWNEIDLGYNRFSSLLHLLPSLRVGTLNLQHCNLSDNLLLLLHPHSLFFQSVQHLRLNGNSAITIRGIEALLKRSSLVSLDVRRSGLRRHDLPAVEALLEKENKQLLELRLSIPHSPRTIHSMMLNRCGRNRVDTYSTIDLEWIQHADRLYGINGVYYLMRRFPHWCMAA